VGVPMSSYERASATKLEAVIDRLLFRRLRHARKRNSVQRFIGSKR